MTLGDVTELLREAAWFQRLGSFQAREGYIALRNLKAWRSDSPIDDAEAEAIATHMAWLPSTVSEEDPLGDEQSKELIRKAGLEEESRKAKLFLYREALGAIGGATHPLLRVGPHDFTGTAKGAGAYAARAAAVEVVAGKSGPWCRLLELYRSGFWPCGLMPDRRIVVL